MKIQTRWLMAPWRRMPLQTIILGLVLALGLLLPSQMAGAADRNFDLSFTRGSKISTVMANAVVRGDRDFYRFQASTGQTASIAITAIENNAVFRLQYQPGSTWADVAGAVEARAWSGRLPQSTGNKYRIEVGGTRGNATYDLFVGIAAK